MATFVKFEVFPKDFAAGVHTFGSDTFKMALSNTAPNAGTDETLSDITQIAAGNGYSTGGLPLANVTLSEASGVAKVVVDDLTITASGGSMAEFRYLIVYNDTPTSPADPLGWYYDYGSGLVLADGESLSVDFDGTNGVFTLA